MQGTLKEDGSEFDSSIPCDDFDSAVPLSRNYRVSRGIGNQKVPLILLDFTGFYWVLLDSPD